MRWLFIIFLSYLIFRITKPLFTIFFIKKEIDKKHRKNIIKQKIKKNEVENFGLKLKLLSELQYTLGIFLIDKNILYCYL